MDIPFVVPTRLCFNPSMPVLLACPDCGGSLTNEGAVLRCACASWPVVADIPILAPWARNRRFTPEEALARHLPPPRGFSARLLRRLLPGTRPILRQISRSDCTFLELAAELGRTRDLDYFRYRFSDLSYVASVALLAPLSRGPVLDLACGAGHLIHALLRQLPKSVVVGLDLNFTLLYLAKRFVAPGALLVCADASRRLPFLDGVFESAVGADAFQYLADPAGTAGELLRVTRGSIVLPHFFDPGLVPGVPRYLEPCLQALAPRSPRLYAEHSLLQTFLDRRELDLSRPGAAPDDVVSVTAGVEPRLYPDARLFAAGSTLNPLYEVREEGDAIQLRRRSLSAAHDERYRRYEAWMPETLTVTREQIAAADPELVRKFVLLDLPPNYC
jgi:SAM-dependent methyltransferase